MRINESYFLILIILLCSCSNSDVGYHTHYYDRYKEGNGYYARYKSENDYYARYKKCYALHGKNK